MKNLDLKLLYIFDVYKNLRIVQKLSETLSWKIDKDASSLKPTETQSASLTPNVQSTIDLKLLRKCPSAQY